jgi:two-component system NtrC family sensor kinase
MVGVAAMKSPLRYLSGRLFLLLLAGMLIVFSIHTYINIKTTSSNLTDFVYASADRASDLIVRSTRYSMLLNRKEDVHETITTLGGEPGFVGISIYNKEGEVMFSTDSARVGQKVDLDAEACNICHASALPLVSVPTKSRMRVYKSPEQGHVLGLINPIRNEPECFNAACHAHSPEQTVLGVLDVKMSLASVDDRVGKAQTAMITSSLAMLALIAVLSGIFIYRTIRRPILRLKRGMITVAAGDLDTRMGGHTDDEIGELALAFDTMADDLKTAREELRDWGRTLEDRIATKTDELQQAQSQIVHMEKMASLGKLSASVAHEINNPLFSILTYSKLVLREIESIDLDEEGAESLRKYLSIIQTESSRCGDIVKNLLDFARRSGGEFKHHHLNEIIEHTLQLLAHHFEMQQIAVHCDLMTGDETLVCDAKQIQQAIIAPCINAVEAMSDGGSLTIRTLGVGDGLIVEIVDTGVGIPEDILPNIFEPFFTTKEGEAGLGLGLAVVYGIVTRHQGNVDVRSTPDHGTTFTMRFPKHPSLDEVETPGETTPGVEGISDKMKT